MVVIYTQLTVGNKKAISALEIAFFVLMPPFSARFYLLSLLFLRFITFFAEVWRKAVI